MRLQPNRILSAKAAWVMLAMLVSLSAPACASDPLRPSAGAARIPADSLAAPTYIGQLLAYEKKYPFVEYEDNFLQWKDFGAIAPFFMALQQTDKRQMRVLHIGDSHVQADIHTGVVRNRMQELFGAGGRGLVFPYSAAKTHTAYDYSSTHWGVWDYARNIQPEPKLPLGVSGVTVRTADQRAGFTLTFNKYYEANQNRRVRFYMASTDSTFSIQVMVNGLTTTVDTLRPIPGQPYLDYTSRVAVEKLMVQVVQEDSSQNHLMLFGVSLESPQNKGVLYHSVGINGADFQALLRQEHMSRQIQLLRPDLVFLDLAGNEYFSGGLDAAGFEARLRTVITRVKVGAPNAAVLVGNSQDINRYRYHTVKECQAAAAIAKRVAFDMGCVYYNYYEVAGGPGSMSHWFSYGLAKYDRVHLNTPGYTHKGELFVNAYLGSYYTSLTGEVNSPEFAARKPRPTFASVVAQRAAPQRAVVAASGNAVTYTVQPGDVLGTIASRYGVYVSQLQAWNHLPGTMIRVGQKLVIYPTRTPAPQPARGGASVARTTPSATSTSSRASAATHTVRSGDTLWDIAQQYGTSVDAICRASGLARNATLKPGQVLKLR